MSIYTASFLWYSPQFYYYYYFDRKPPALDIPSHFEEKPPTPAEPLISPEISPLISPCLCRGTFSALSLPIGALISFFFTIAKRWNCALLAYGAGALLFALTVEIFGEAIIEYETRNDLNKTPMAMLAIGCFLGSFIFSAGNYLIENQGGFLRKLALRTRFLRREMMKRESVRRESLRRESSRVSQRFPRPSYGTSTISTTAGDEESTTTTTEADVDDSFQSGGERTRLQAEDRKNSSKGLSRPSVRILIDPEHEDGEEPDYLDFSKDHHDEEAQIEQEFLDEKKDAQVGIAIWLGILIDAFPESLVIGILVAHGISYTFIAGVFVSNLPEAMSSSTIMLQGGFSRTRVILMWLSITLITGLGSVIGTAAFAGEPSNAKHLAELFVEGIAAGAMLVMIAETALPEAFRHAGHLVGFSTLFGFLTAYLIKLFEEQPL